MVRYAKLLADNATDDGGDMTDSTEKKGALQLFQTIIAAAQAGHLSESDYEKACDVLRRLDTGTDMIRYLTNTYEDGRRSRLIKPAINQVWAERAEIMERFINWFGYPIRALEIGTWFCAGSTQIWMRNIPNGSSLTLVDPWAPYSSSADLKNLKFSYADLDAKTFEAYISTIMAVKACERDREGDIEIITIRGKSSSVLPTLQDGQYDFIYIDGDHKYEAARCDMGNATRLIKKDRIIDNMRG